MIVHRIKGLGPEDFWDAHKVKVGLGSTVNCVATRPQCVEYFVLVMASRAHA